MLKLAQDHTAAGLDHRTLRRSCRRFPRQHTRASAWRVLAWTRHLPPQACDGFWLQPLQRVTCWAHAPLTRQPLQPSTRTRHWAGLRAGPQARGNWEAWLPQPRGATPLGNRSPWFESFPLTLQMKEVIRLLFCEIL